MNRSTKAWKRLTADQKKAIRAHLTAVADLPCVVTGRFPATLHHCHGGSLADAGINRGAGQRPSDWLTIPIIADLHTGNNGIDYGKGVRSWEAEHGAQMDHLKTVSEWLGYDVFEKLASHG